VTVGGFCNRLGKEYNCIHNASDLEILAIRVVSIVIMLFDGERGGKMCGCTILLRVCKVDIGISGVISFPLKKSYHCMGAAKSIL
jgi:hypothetical protein